MRKLLTGLLLLAAAWIAAPTAAQAQSACAAIQYGAVLTAAQWQGCFESKLDFTTTGNFVTGVPTSAATDVACWNNTTATSLKDCAGDTLTGAYAWSGVQTFGADVGIGTETNPQSALVLSANTATGLASPVSGNLFNIFGVNSSSAAEGIFSYAAQTGLYLGRADGTAASSSALASGDDIAALNYGGYNGSAWVSAPARILAIAAGTWTGSNNGAIFEIDTTLASSGTRAQAVRIMAGVYVGTNTSPTDPGTGSLALAANLTIGGITGSAQCLHVNSAGLVSGTGSDCGSGGGGGTPGGSAGQVQFNSAGVFGGAANVNYASGNLGVGTETSPQAQFVISKNAATGLTAPNSNDLAVVYGVDSGNPNVNVAAYASSSYLLVTRADGTGASPTALASGDQIGGFIFDGYNGSAYPTTIPARIIGLAAGTWTGSANGLSIEIDTTAAGTTTRAQAMRIMAGVYIGTSTSPTDPGAGGLTVSGTITGPDTGTWTSSGILNIGSTLEVGGNAILSKTNLVLYGASSGADTFGAASAAGATITIPNGTYNLVGDSITQTLSAKTLASPTISGTMTGPDAGTWASNGITDASLYGGTAANATLQLDSTSNVSPSGDHVNIFGSTITLRSQVGGYSIVNIGLQANTAGKLDIADASASYESLIAGTPAGAGIATLPGGTYNIATDSTAQTLSSKILSSPAISGPTTHSVIIGEGSSSVNGIGPGTTGQCLVASTSADPSYIGGCEVLLNTLTASTSASLADTTSITSTFNDYVLTCENLVPSGNGESLELQYYVGGTLQTSGYAFSNFVVNGSGGTGAGGSSSAAFINVNDSANMIPNSDPGISFTALIVKPSVSHKVQTFGTYNMNNFTSGTVGSGFFGGYNGTAGVVTGINLLFTAGNITSGTCKIYGKL